jgi:hypothetical protein
VCELSPLDKEKMLEESTIIQEGIYKMKLKLKKLRECDWEEKDKFMGICSKIVEVQLTKHSRKGGLVGFYDDLDETINAVLDSKYQPGSQKEIDELSVELRKMNNKLDNITKNIQDYDEYCRIIEWKATNDMIQKDIDVLKKKKKKLEASEFDISSFMDYQKLCKMEDELKKLDIAFDNLRKYSETHTKLNDIMGKVLKSEKMIEDLEESRGNMKGSIGVVEADMKNVRDKKKKLEECNEGTDEYAAAQFQYEYFNSTQKALKVFMNTFYGEIGNQRSPFFMVQVAGGITINGGRNVKLAQKFTEENGCKIYYGDSVPGDSPLILQDEFDHTLIREIRSIVDESEWIAYPQFKIGQVGIIEKQQAFTNYKIWVDGGWKKIIRIIRHRTNKKMYRINTNIGCVDVTEDHSLITKDMNKIIPSKCRIGDELCHSYIDEFNSKWTGLCCDNGNDIPDFIINAPIEIRRSFFAGVCMSDSCKLESEIIRISCKEKIYAMGIYYIARSIGYTHISVEQNSQNMYLISCSDTKFEGNPMAIRGIFELPPVCHNEYVYDIETSCGRFLTGVGCIQVSNTDSIYTQMPDHYFMDIDRAYFLGNMDKEIYWCRLVEITLKVIAKVRDDINEYFHKDNGTRFLTMAFEEALFPVLFASKKKYVGIAHEHHPSFAKPLDLHNLDDKYTKEFMIKFPEYTDEQIRNVVDDAIITKRKKQFFIRGLDIVKRGMPNFAKEIILNILERMVAIDNHQELFDIIKEDIRKIYSREWKDPKLMYKFIMSDQFKPHKNNVKMHVFVKRMAELYNIKIKPFERVRYIVAAKYPYKYDIRGRQVPLSIGEKMELADIATKYGHTIDIDEYMASKVFGQLGRLIAYRHEFVPTNAAEVDLSDDKEVKDLNDAIYKAATKWVKQYSSQFTNTHCKLGPLYQKISKEATSITYRKLQHYGAEDKKLFIAKTDEELDELPKWIASRAESEAKLKTKTYGKTYIKELITEYVKANKITKDTLPGNRFGKSNYKTVPEYVRIRLLPIFMKIERSSEHIFKIKHEENMNELIKHLYVIRQVYFKLNEMVKRASEYVVSNNDLSPLYAPGIDKSTMNTNIKSLMNFIATNQTNISEQIILDDGLEDAIKTYNGIYNKLVSNYRTVLMIRSIYDELQKMKNNSVGYNDAGVSKADINEMVKNMNEL